MNPEALTPVLRVLRVCLHLLVLGLLAIAAVRALRAQVPGAAAVVVVAVGLALVYAAGSVLPAVRRSTRAAGLWLAAVVVCWLVLLVLTADGVWLAFPLFFLQLHLLPLRTGLTAVALTTAAAIAGFGWHQHTLTMAMVVGPVLGAAVAVATVLGYQALYRESDARRRLIVELTGARAELATAERTAGMLAERERLAREVHDTLAQGLSSIQLFLRAAERALPEQPEVAAGHVRQAREAAADNLAEARHFVRAQTPPSLEEGALSAALARLVRATSEAGPATTLAVRGEDIDLPTAHEVALLRVAQSALANVLQHAGATRAQVTLAVAAHEVHLRIADDGVGMPVRRPGATAPAGRRDRGGFGLATMRARAAALDGSCVVEPGPGGGTVVSVRLPLHSAGAPTSAAAAAPAPERATP